MNEGYLDIAKTASLKAGDVIMEVFNSEDFGIELKEDESPVTKADFAANDVINALLSKTGLPILSEENDEIPYVTRKDWPSYWLVDPLDGTKSFIKREHDFTVNIALIEDGRAVLGVVYIPYTNILYWGSTGGDAFKLTNGQTTQIHISELADPIRIVASKNHFTEETKSFIDLFDDPIVTQLGSTLKMMAIAEGNADVFPRMRPSTMEWDTAAAQVILEAAGGHLRTLEGKKLTYNRKDLLNPGFIATNSLELTRHPEGLT